MEAYLTVPLTQTAQTIFQTLTTTLAATSFLFPPQADISDGDSFDYIVVGAGSAGSVIASRLTEDPNINVLLIEAGGDPPAGAVLSATFPLLKNTEVDWNYTSVNDGSQKYHKNKVTDMTRGKMLGGCSSINFMEYVRGSPEDYNNWANVVNDQSWSYDNILPYFKKTEKLTDEGVINSPLGRFHGTKGNVGVIKQHADVTHKYLDALKEIGQDVVFDTNGNMTLGYNEPMYNIVSGIRQSTAVSFLSPAKDRSNLYVAKHTLATKVIFDDNNNAIAVEAINEDGEKIRLEAKKEIILSAGSINTPQLLMLSGIGPKQHLEDMGINVIADLPVGENLQDHSPVVLVYPTEIKPIEPINPLDTGVPAVIGYVAMNKTQEYPDYQSIILIIPTVSLLQLCAFYFTFDNNICQKFYDESVGREVLFVYVNNLHPTSRGHILLRSTDPLDYPLISLGIYSDESDLMKAMSYIQDFDRIADSEYFKQVDSKLLVPPQCEDFETGSQEYWRCHAETMVSTVFHYVGTCAMGTVVDSRLRVFGVNRLRVADGSVMPFITRGNTNAPVMMIGEKAADMIKEDYENAKTEDYNLKNIF